MRYISVVPAPLTLRRAVLADASVIAELARQTFEETFAGLYTEQDQRQFLETSYSTELQSAELRDPAWRTFLLESAGRAIGFAQMVLGHAPEGHPLEAASELRRIYVLRSSHGTGGGSRLMQAAVDEAAGAGSRTFWLGVWERNLKARTFYERWGFERFAEHAFHVGQRVDTDYLLKRRLGPSGGAHGKSSTPGAPGAA